MTSPFAAIPLALALFSAGREVPPRHEPFPRPLVTATWLRSHLDDPDLVILHVSAGPAAWIRGHVPGARWLDYHSILSDSTGLAVEIPPVPDLVRAFRLAGLEDGRRVVLYGDILPVMRAWLTLDVLGLAGRAAVLDGGLEAWVADGGPVEREATADSVPIGGRLTVHPSSGRIVDAEWVRRRMHDPRTLLLDVRPDDEYTGDDAGHGMHLAGHIPGAVQVRWEDLVGGDGRLLPAPALRHRLAALGADGAEHVVVYCMVGLRASLVYFVARMLDLHVRFYDGSWEDWSNRQYPVEAGRPSPPAAPRQSCL